jgi:hypothetical protein
VAEAVREVLKSAQDLIREFASRYKAFEADDVLNGQNHAVEEVKRLELLDLVSRASTYEPKRQPS